VKAPTAAPAAFGWERNLPPAIVGLLRGIPWALVFVALISVVGIATKGQHIHWPGWLAPSLPASVFALRTLEGMIDQAKQGNPAAFGDLGTVLHSLEGLAAQIATQPKAVPPGGAPATISIHVGTADQVRATGLPPADLTSAPAGPVLPPSNIQGGVAPEVQPAGTNDGTPAGQDTTAFVPPGQFP
jgi:hypothetical protein